MPPLKACGRSWEFGSDDLVFPGTILVGIRSFWLFLQVLGIIIFHKALTCEHSHIFSSVAYISLINTSIIIVIEILIVIASSRGTIRNSYPRRFVSHLLHLRILFFLGEIISLLIKTILAARPSKVADLSQCPDISTAVILARVVVSVTWFIILGFVLSVLIYMDPCHCYSSKLTLHVNEEEEDEEDIHGNQESNHGNQEGNHGNQEGGITTTRRRSSLVLKRWHLTQSVWEKRFQTLCCFAGSDETHRLAYREVAEIFAHLFHDTNLVLSDIVAGLVLLQKEQLKYERLIIASQSCTSASSVSLNFREPNERDIFKNALHYMRFALGVYTWSIHIYMNPTCGCCQVMSNVRLPCCCRRKRPTPKHIHNDNSCFCNLAGFIAMTTINEMDIIYASFENDIYKTPFIVCLDHDEKSVVVAIRGTLSLQDIITDLSASTHPIELPDWPRFIVHGGMYQSALWIKDRLEEDSVLENAFDKVPNYKLVLTGHSLGSGCAGILSILLKETYPDLTCYCFSPTGSLLNSEAAAYTQSFITSVTLGQDMVCRLSVRTAHDFTRDLIKILELSKKPKYRILLEGALETIGKCCGRDILFTEEEEEEVSERSPLATDSDNEDLSSPLLLSQPNDPLSFDIFNTNNDDPSLSPSDTTLPSLYPPGRIIHIVDTLEERNCFFATRRLEARWSGVGHFNKLTISPDMLKDHFPDVLYRAMQRIWEQNGSQLEEILIE